MPWWKSKSYLATSAPGESWPLRFVLETGHQYSCCSPRVYSPCPSCSPTPTPLTQPCSAGPHLLLLFLQSYILFSAPFSTKLAPSEAAFFPVTFCDSTEARARHIPGLGSLFSLLKPLSPHLLANFYSFGGFCLKGILHTSPDPSD